MKTISRIDEALLLIQEGKILAYPTEAVYGLGCDPFNQDAVERLLFLKQRPVDKGLILLIADWSQLPPLIRELPDKAWDRLHRTWPGPVTWIFPKSNTVPHWISGHHDSIAIRMTAHPIARELCMDKPLVSTSANRSSLAPAIDLAGVSTQFPFGIDALLLGPLGGLKKPSEIYDALTEQRIR